MLSLTKLRKSRATESGADVVELISISAPPSPPSSQKGLQKTSPKVKPMIIIDEPTSPSSPVGEDAELPSPTLLRASIRPTTLSLDTMSDPSSSFSTNELESAPSSPTASSSSPKSRDSQSQMRGFSKVSFRIKQLVSKEKRRFAEDGFNLDLTYVTNRLIAFGYPAESLEGIYRNHYKDVYNFFEKRHPGRYRIYNLCSERTYDKEKFHNRVAEYRFDDHCPPPIALFLPFCQDVDEWLQAHPENVAAIHCKAGKGRTGVMICAYLLYIGAWKTAHSAMEFFGAARSLKRQGVTIPSQRRFIGYFGEMCHRTRRSTRDETEEMKDDIDTDVTRENELDVAEYKSLWEDALEGRGIATKRRMFQRQLALPASKHLKLVSITLSGVYTQRKLDPRVHIECGKTSERSPFAYHFNRPFSDVHALAARVATSEMDKHDSVDASEAREAPPSPSSSPSSGRGSTSMPHTELKLVCDRCIVWDEVQVHLRNRNGAKIGHFWFHTSFVACNTTRDDDGDDTLELVLKKHEIDKVIKDIKRGHKKYAPSFCIKVCFKYATEEEIQAAESVQRMALKVDSAAANSSSSSLLTTRFSSPGSVAPDKTKAVWAVEKRSEGQPHKQFSRSSKTSSSPAAATEEHQHSKSDRGAQSRQTALFTKQRPSPLVANDTGAEQAQTDGSVEVFGTRRGGDDASEEDTSTSVRPVEAACASPKAASPRQQLTRFFSARKKEPPTDH
uniref:Phosphatidylinositol-3,4,5-trisphosphate 3-phosphatase n=1 Tax=Globisporangium ultimum (strain ATCC 200006 / CBS 805.95 / DAOM BR144) TaxID=431595 RepID=K3WR79_GLOUD